MSFLVYLLPAAILLGAGLLLYRSLKRKNQNESTFHLDVLTCGAILLPLFMLSATRVAHTGLIPRYLLPTILGLVLGAGYGLSLLSTRVVALVGVLLFFCIAIQETGFWLSYHEDRLLMVKAQPSGMALIQSTGHGELPVVVSEGHDYLEFNHYAPRALSQRLTFVADPEAAVAHHRPDTNDRNLLILRDFAPLNVVEYAKFKNTRREFLLYSDPTAENNPDWFVSRLEVDGWSLERLATDGRSSVYLVTAKTESH
jgi:hypothetical protein